jgi:beta-lactamase regulating signal transducer with metallopeptidase domain
MSDMVLFWGERSVPFAVGLLLQTTAIAALGLIAGRLMRLRGPWGESAVYRATLVAILVAIAWNSLAAGRFRSPVSVTDRVVAVAPAAEPRNVPISLITTVHGDGGNVPLATAAVSRSASAPASNGSDLPAQAALAGQDSEATGPKFPLTRGLVCLAAWGIVALVLIGRQIVGHFALARLARSSTRISTGHVLDLLENLTSGGSAPVLRVHAHVAAPFLAGVRHPVIYLPADYATQYDHETLRAILSHELEHVTRRDCAWFVLAHVTTSLFWPHPLVWMLERRLSQASEEACDAAVLAHGCPAGAYAASLLALAERMGMA